MTAVIGISELTTGGFDSSTTGSKTVTVTVNPAAPVFTSIAAFGDWLSAQPGNTAATAYRVKLNVNDLGGNSWTSGSLGNALYANFTKYVNLDLSGSTITSIGERAFSSC